MDVSDARLYLISCLSFDDVAYFQIYIWDLEIKKRTYRSSGRAAGSSSVSPSFQGCLLSPTWSVWNSVWAKEKKEKN